jgi:5-methylcytosine-specific restriction enzyme A
VRKLTPFIRHTVDARAVRPQAKTADPFYLTQEYRAWRMKVIRNAGRRCQAIEDTGRRCTKAEPYHRMFADHIVELRDGGAPYDLANGMCVCGSHHTAKTMRARAERMRR